MGRKQKPGIILKAGRTSADLGRLTAEYDSHLGKYYVGRDRYVNRALNMEDQASFFLGPKGSGKSAILQMVHLEMADQPNRIIRLSPTQLAFSALANIDIASPLLQDPQKKQWLYKSLWDYIFATEVGGREFVDEGSIIGKLKNFVRGKDERLVRRLLRMKYDDNGQPESLSTRFLKLIKEIELSGTVDIDGLQLGAKGTIDPREGGSNKQGQFKLLGMIHQVAARLADTIHSQYYVLIDDLDVDWHNEPVQNEIVAAMFASLRKVCRPPHLKCVVSIQDRIFRELPIEHKDKFRDSLCSVDWDAPSVMEMIERRILYVLDISRPKIWNGLFPPGAFDFIWKRIGGKPREAIRFASICIETARKNNHKAIDDEDMKAAMKKFSSERLEDIASELEYLYPSFIGFLRHFNGYPKEFPTHRIKDAVENCILSSMEPDKNRLSWIGGYENNYHELLKVMLENQILLFKNSRTDTAQIFNPLEHDVFSPHAFVAFHPMYNSGLGLLGS